MQEEISISSSKDFYTSFKLPIRMRLRTRCRGIALIDKRRCYLKPLGRPLHNLLRSPNTALRGTRSSPYCRCTTSSLRFHGLAGRPNRRGWRTAMLYETPSLPICLVFGPLAIVMQRSSWAQAISSLHRS